MKHLFTSATILLTTFLCFANVCFANDDINVDNNPKLKSNATDLNGQPIKLDINGTPLITDITNVRGPNYYRSTGNRGDGDIDCACDAQFSAGDRVTLLVDKDNEPNSPPIGALGTVLCAYQLGGTMFLLVEWDNYNDGHTQSWCPDCGEADETTIANRWYVECDMIAVIAGACCINQSCETLPEEDCLAGGGLYQGDNTDCKTSNCGDGDIGCACNAQFSAGDRVTLLVDKDNEYSPPIGALGTVLCARQVGGIMFLLVEWDNYNDGHTQAYCPDCGEADETTIANRWYVECDMIAVVPGCLGDLNYDGVVSVDDLLILIGAWGACP